MKYFNLSTINVIFDRKISDVHSAGALSEAPLAFATQQYAASVVLKQIIFQ